ncbi:MAG: PD-(D/E)XK nuclease family protein [Lachnospiraceae bacterium]|nr:PD-(D/E)XK nuclease family protein [Lachnospiraceae bacterium]
MALSFIFGPSGSGKSTYLQERFLKGAQENPAQKYYLIVPDQYTLLTQQELVKRSPNGGILNIDILSFGRLSYRVFEETGGADIPVLDDTGKNLILRVIAQRLQEEGKLGVLASRLHRPGYIHEVKSALSEFMQYGIGVADVKKMVEDTGKRSTLSGKLKDLALLYEGFEDYIKDHYITTEESLQVLAGQIGKSEKLRDAIIAFDGFTGFTPVQLDVVQELLLTAKDVYFTLTTDHREDPFTAGEEQALFYLTSKTVQSLMKRAEAVGIAHGNDIVLDGTVHRFAQNPELGHLEQALFRYPVKTYPKKLEKIMFHELSMPREEVRHCAREIKKLVRTRGYDYRDIAVVCGNLEGYASHVKAEFEKLEIPCFIDQTNGIMLNPFVELIRSLLRLREQDFSFDSVNHYLRSGIPQWPLDRIDALDNYLRACGIRGKSRWSRMFDYLPAASDKEEAMQTLAAFNAIRRSLMDLLEPLLNLPKMASASQRTRVLYDIVVAESVQEKLQALSEELEAAGDLIRAREYRQIYPYIMELFSQIDELLGDQPLDDREFADLLDAGFSEMEVGNIPGSIDRVVVGDIERTRLGNTRVLFFVGVNDGNIPKRTDKGGIISDIDRDYLEQSAWELAPSPRAQMYIQRLYLYMNMTKPSDLLYVSWVRSGNDGKALRPAYLVDTMKGLFPQMEVVHPEEIDELYRVENRADSEQLLADGLRRAAEGSWSEKEQQEVALLLKALRGSREEREIKDLLEAAFIRYRELPLDAKLASALYGEHPQGSVTRLEEYASCGYAHFLKYGMKLREREDFRFEAADMGTLFHEVLAEFAKEIGKRGYQFRDFPLAEGKEIVHTLIEQQSAGYGNGILYDTARSNYVVRRMERILNRTIETLQFQFRQGDFEPVAFELPFKITNPHMEFRGKIDRLDRAGGDADGYLSVVDYKSGNKAFDTTLFANGLQIQLLTYLQAAMQHETNHENTIPAGVLYYHLDDPMLNGKAGEEAGDLSEEICAQLRLNGLVNEAPESLQHYEHDLTEAGKVLPLRRKKDGSWYQNDLLIKEHDLRLMMSYNDRMIRKLSEEIMSGKIPHDPYEAEKSDACKYCPYQAICGYDAKIPGYQKRTLSKEDRELFLQKLREEEA